MNPNRFHGPRPSRQPLRIVVTVDRIEDRCGTLEAGLQDISGGLDPGIPTADGVRFECDASVRQRPDGTVSYSGAQIHGPSRQRFLYLSYRHRGDLDWVRRVKIILPDRVGADVRQLEAHVRDSHAPRARFDGSGWTPMSCGTG